MPSYNSREMWKSRVSVGVVVYLALLHCGISQASLENDYKYIRGMLRQVNNFNGAPPAPPCPELQDPPQGRHRQSEADYKKSREFFESSDVFQKFQGMENVLEHKNANRLIIFNDELNEYWILDGVEKDKVFIDRENKKILVPNRDLDYSSREIRFAISESTEEFLLIEIVKGIVTVPVKAIVEALSPTQQRYTTLRLMRPLMHEIAEKYYPGMTKAEILALMDERVSNMSEEELQKMRKDIASALTGIAERQQRESKTRYKDEFPWAETEAEIAAEFKPKVLRNLLKQVVDRYKGDPSEISLSVDQPNRRAIQGKPKFMMIDGFGFDGTYLGRLNPRWYWAVNSSTSTSSGFLGGRVSTETYRITEEIPGLAERKAKFFSSPPKPMRWIGKPGEKLLVEYTNGAIGVYDMKADNLAFGNDNPAAKLVFKGQKSANSSQTEKGATIIDTHELKYITMYSPHIDDVILDPKTLKTRNSPTHLYGEAPLDISQDRRFMFVGNSENRDRFSIYDLSQRDASSIRVKLEERETVKDFKWVDEGVGVLLTEVHDQDRRKSRQRLSIRTSENPEEAKLETFIDLDNASEMTYDPATKKLRLVSRNLFGFESDSEEIIFNGKTFEVVKKPKKKEEPKKE